MNVYVVQMTCWDYYCDGMHLAAARLDLESAKTALAEALQKSPDGGNRWMSGYVAMLDTAALIATEDLTPLVRGEVYGDTLRID